jgi:hypothetical protein
MESDDRWADAGLDPIHPVTGPREIRFSIPDPLIQLPGLVRGDLESVATAGVDALIAEGIRRPAPDGRLRPAARFPHVRTGVRMFTGAIALYS